MEYMVGTEAIYGKKLWKKIIALDVLEDAGVKLEEWPKHVHAPYV